MIFFKKKRALKEEDTGYYRYRDSVTGLMNREFLFNEYEKLRGSDDYSAITIRLAGCENLPYYKASERIKEAGEMIARMCSEVVSRVENGDFVLFSQTAEMTKDKLNFFLKEISENGEVYAVCYDKLDKNESFDIFLKRIKRHIDVEAGNNLSQML